MGRRNDHTREELRDLCLEAASRLVASGGLAGLSARRIADDIGYSPGSLYVVFKNLDDIIMHVNAATLADLHVAVAEIPEQHPDPKDAIRTLAHTYLKFAATHANRWRCIFEHHLGREQVLPDWYLARVADMFGVVGRPIAKLRPDLSGPELGRAARALWSAVHGVCILGLDDQLDLTKDHSVEEVLDALMDTYVAGLPHA